MTANIALLHSPNCSAASAVDYPSTPWLRVDVPTRNQTFDILLGADRTIDTEIQDQKRIALGFWEILHSYLFRSLSSMMINFPDGFILSLFHGKGLIWNRSFFGSEISVSDGIRPAPTFPYLESINDELHTLVLSMITSHEASL